MRRSSLWIYGVILVVLTVLLVRFAVPVMACGFHASYFRGNFYDDWVRISGQLKAEVKDKGARKPFAPGLSNQKQGVIVELIRILKFVDPYNGAPDSPSWMHYEEGRQNARESAIKILHELGADAALPLVEALVDEIRYDTIDRREGLIKIQKLRDAESAILAKLRNELTRFPEVRMTWERKSGDSLFQDRVLGAWRQRVVTEPIPFEKPKVPGGIQIRGPGQPEPKEPPATHRRMSWADWQRLQSGLFGGGTVTDLASFLGSEAQTNQDKIISGLIQEFQLAKVATQGEVATFNSREIDSKQKKGLSPISSGGSDMVPCEEYAMDLEATLVRIGLPALRALAMQGNHANPAVRTVMHRIIKSIQAQRQPIKPDGLEPENTLPLADLMALAVLLWDYGDPQEGSKFALRAEQELQKKGEEAIPKIIRLMSVDALRLVPECEKGLKLITGLNLGSSYRVWQQWHDRKVASEKINRVVDEFSGELLIESKDNPQPEVAPQPRDSGNPKENQKDLMDALLGRNKEEPDAKKPDAKKPEVKKPDAKKPAATKVDEKKPDEKQTKKVRAMQEEEE